MGNTAYSQDQHVPLPAHPEAVTEALKTITHLGKGKFLGDHIAHPERVGERMRDALNLQTILRAALDPEDYKMNRKERHALISLKNDSTLLEGLRDHAKEMAVDVRHHDHNFRELIGAITTPPSIDEIEAAARGASGWRNMLSFGMNKRNTAVKLAKFVAVEQAEEALALIQKSEEHPQESPTYESLRLKALQQINSAVFTISHPDMFIPLLDNHQQLLTNIHYTPFDQTLAEHGFIRDEADQPLPPEDAALVIDAILMMKIGNRIRHIVQTIPDEIDPQAPQTHLEEIITRLEGVTRAFSAIPHHDSNNDLIQELRGARALISGFTHALIHSELTPQEKTDTLANLRHYGQQLVNAAYHSAYASLAFMDGNANSAAFSNMEHVSALRGRIADFILLQEHGSDLRMMNAPDAALTDLQQQIQNIRNVSARLVAAIEPYHDQLAMSAEDWDKANHWLTDDVGISMTTIRSMMSAQHLSGIAQEEQARATAAAQVKAEEKDASLLKETDSELQQSKPKVDLAANPFGS